MSGPSCCRLHCPTPEDDVRQVKGLALCSTHRLMAYGQLEPKLGRHRLTPEQRVEKYRQAWRKRHP